MDTSLESQEPLPDIGKQLFSKLAEVLKKQGADLADPREREVLSLFNRRTNGAVETVFIEFVNDSSYPHSDITSTLRSTGDLENVTFPVISFKKVIGTSSENQSMTPYADHYLPSHLKDQKGDYYAVDNILIVDNQGGFYRIEDVIRNDPSDSFGEGGEEHYSPVDFVMDEDDSRVVRAGSAEARMILATVRDILDGNYEARVI